MVVLSLAAREELWELTSDQAVRVVDLVVLVPNVIPEQAPTY